MPDIFLLALIVFCFVLTAASVLASTSEINKKHTLMKAGYFFLTGIVFSLWLHQAYSNQKIVKTKIVEMIDIAIIDQDGLISLVQRISYDDQSHNLTETYKVYFSDETKWRIDYLEKFKYGIWLTIQQKITKCK